MFALHVITDKLKKFFFSCDKFSIKWKSFLYGIVYVCELQEYRLNNESNLLASLALELWKWKCRFSAVFFLFSGIALLLPYCSYLDVVEYMPSTRLTSRCHYYDSEVWFFFYPFNVYIDFLQILKCNVFYFILSRFKLFMLISKFV